MTSVTSKNAWIRRQQCPCGERRCYISYEGDGEETSLTSQQVKKESNSKEDMVTPYVGMVFKSDDEAFDYYGSFARKSGFSIRKERSRLSPQLGIYKRDFVCYRSGFATMRKKPNGEHHRDRKSVRCGCDAKMYLSKEVVEGESQWLVVQFSNVHNHELLEDDQVCLLPAYRKIDEADQDKIQLLFTAGFSVHRIVKVLEMEKGIQGRQLPFLERDVRNFLQNRKKIVQQNDASLAEKREIDTVELLEACRATKDMDGDFMYDFTVDDNDKVENIAWSFGDSVHAYTIYGDVAYLDTTYQSIAYGMHFGGWFGIDNNGRPILLGCFLLREETSNSFAWTLQVFTRFMGGRHPHTIITDIDPRLQDAIRNKLQNTRHCIPISNILTNVTRWFYFPLGARFAEFKSEFDDLYRLESIEDFELRWNQMVSTFGLGSDKHSLLLYSVRTSWAVCYVRGCFVARMTEAVYSKAIDSFLKGVFSAQTCLRSFFEQVAISTSSHNQPSKVRQYVHNKTCNPIEEHARRILSRFAFNAFQHELVLSMQYAASEMANGTFLVRHFKSMEHERFVIWLPEDEIHCSCKEFESSGILCRHALRVFVVKNCFQLPDKYIPARWRRETSLASDDGDDAWDHNDDWFQEFQSLTESLLTESSVTNERQDSVRQKLMKELTRLLHEVRDMSEGEEVTNDCTLSPNGLSSARAEQQMIMQLLLLPLNVHGGTAPG